eukprot:2100000-Rhodomonas_salina.6
MQGAYKFRPVTHKTFLRSKNLRLPRPRSSRLREFAMTMQTFASTVHAGFKYETPKDSSATCNGQDAKSPGVCSGSQLAESSPEAQCQGPQEANSKPTFVTPPAPTDVSLLFHLFHASDAEGRSKHSSRPQGSGPKPDTAQDMPFSHQPSQAAKSSNKVFPRRKAGQNTRTNSQPVVLSEGVLSALFDLPLQE